VSFSGATKDPLRPCDEVGRVYGVRLKLCVLPLVGHVALCRSCNLSELYFFFKVFLESLSSVGARTSMSTPVRSALGLRVGPHD
jgi:hypothetical protein